MHQHTDPVYIGSILLEPNRHKPSRVPTLHVSEWIDRFAAAGFDVLLDDRDDRPGVMFADAELIGIPHRVTIGERGLKDGVIEYQPRRAAAGENGEAQKIALADAKEFLTGLLER